MTDLDTRLAQLAPAMPAPPVGRIDAAVRGRRRRRRSLGIVAVIALGAGGAAAGSRILADDHASLATEGEQAVVPLWALAESWEDGVEHVLDLDHGLRVQVEVEGGKLCLMSRYGEMAAEYPDAVPHPSDRGACTLPAYDEALIVLSVGTGYGPSETALIGAVAPDGGVVRLRFPSGEEQEVDLITVPRWQGLAVFGVPITWDDESAPEVVLVGHDGRDLEVRMAGPVSRPRVNDPAALPAFDVQELGPDSLPLGSLPDGEHFGRLTGFVDSTDLAAILFVPGEVLVGDEAEAAHAASGEQHTEHTGIYISPQWDPPVLLSVDRAGARFDVLDGRWDPPGVEVAWPELVALLRGTHVFPLYWTGFVHLRVEEGQVTYFMIQYLP